MKDYFEKRPHEFKADYTAELPILPDPLTEEERAEWDKKVNEMDECLFKRMLQGRTSEEDKEEIARIAKSIDPTKIKGG